MGNNIQIKNLGFLLIIFIISSVFFVGNYIYNYSYQDFFFRSIPADSSLYHNFTKIINNGTRYQEFKNIFEESLFKTIINWVHKYIFFLWNSFEIKINNTVIIPLYSYLFHNNLLLIFFFQLTIFIYAINKLEIFLGSKVYLLIIFNFYILASLSPLNKEIMVYLAILYLILFNQYKNWPLLAISIFFSFFSRGQFFLFHLFFCLLLVIYFYKPKFSISIAYLVCFFILIIITFKYENIAMSHINESFQSSKSLGITKFLDEINKQYPLHFLTIFIKIFGNLFGGLIKQPNLSNLEYILNYLSQIYFLVLVVLISIEYKKLNFKDFFIPYSITYLIIHSSHSFIHHRYIIPISISLIYIYLKKNKKKII